MSTSRLALVVVVALSAAHAHAQFLLCTQSTTDDVMLLDASTGAVLDPAYIDLAPASPATPIEAIVVGNEIWVTDQIGDKLMRFTLDGTTFLGNVTGNMNNIRGAAYVNGVVYVSNAQAAAPVPQDTIVMFDTAGAFLGYFASGDPFDVLEFQGDLLVPDGTADDLSRFTTAGAFVGIFHASDGVTGIDFPEQLNLNLAGNVIAGGFTSPSGIYEYDATGVQVNYYSTPGSIRGVAQLSNGLYVYSNATGVHTFDSGTNAVVDIVTGVSAHFFTSFAGPQPPGLVAFCFGDGTLADHTTPCPCGNNGAPGNGCGHSFDPNGANLGASGTPANDDVVLHSQFEPASSFTLFMQHENTADTTFHDGVLCAGNPLIRLRGRAAVGGEAFFPNSNFAQDSTTTLSQRGGVFPGQGVRRYYAAWYRNASTTFCPPATANVTNGWKLDW